MQLPPELILDLIQTQPENRGELSKWKRKAAQKYSTALPSNQVLLDAIRRTQNLEARSSNLDSKFQILNSIERLLRVRDVRTLSGVAIVTVLVKPYACPGQCVYCPTEVRMPKSYIETEPAAQRALRLNFDPFIQMTSRLAVLERNGHPTDKIELIVKGGTWSAYPKAYQRWFLKECYRAANEFTGRHSEQREESRDPSAKPQDDVVKPSSYSDVESLNQGDRKLVENYNKKGDWATGESTEEEILATQTINETAAHRIIGLTLETRPDWINEAEVRQLRILGCTRVELGAQAIDDGILAFIKRGHDVASIARAIALLREAGFKVDVHMMPQLPGATPQKDIEMFKLLFDDPRFRPDMVKIYPCVVTPSAELYQWWKSGKYTPYSDEELIETLITIKSEIIPGYCRISRLIRDIPSQHIAAGNKVTNLRETIQRVMKKRGLKCKCLRCREVGHQRAVSSKLSAISLDDRSLELKAYSLKLFVDEYDASGGKEYFLSIESEDRTVVYAFCRLRIPASLSRHCEGAHGDCGNPYRHPELVSGSPEMLKQVQHDDDLDCFAATRNDKLLDLLPEIRDCAFIRELHTYGQLQELRITNQELRERDDTAVQHTGFGKQLMSKAEEIVREQGAQNIAVIAGVGVREYYRKLGYALEGTYMIKEIKR